MSILNKYTKNRALLEGCMVQGYSTEEVVDWCIDFFDPKNLAYQSPDMREG